MCSENCDNPGGHCYGFVSPMSFAPTNWFIGLAKDIFHFLVLSRLTGPTPWWIIGWTFGPLVREIPSKAPENIPQIPKVQISTGFLRP